MNRSKHLNHINLIFGYGYNPQTVDCIAEEGGPDALEGYFIDIELGVAEHIKNAVCHLHPQARVTAHIYDAEGGGIDSILLDGVEQEKQSATFCLILQATANIDWDELEANALSQFISCRWKNK